MLQVIDQGLAHYWGTSEWPEERIEEAWAVADRLGLIGPGGRAAAQRWVVRVGGLDRLLPAGLGGHAGRCACPGSAAPAPVEKEERKGKHTPVSVD